MSPDEFSDEVTYEEKNPANLSSRTPDGSHVAFGIMITGAKTDTAYTPTLQAMYFGSSWLFFDSADFKAGKLNSSITFDPSQKTQDVESGPLVTESNYVTLSESQLFKFYQMAKHGSLRARLNSGTGSVVPSEVITLNRVTRDLFVDCTIAYFGLKQGFKN